MKGQLSLFLSRFLPLVVALAATAVLTTVGSAGPNEGAALLVHTDDSVVYTLGVDYNGASGFECPDDWDCPPYDDWENCALNIGEINPTSGRGPHVATWWVLLAFPEMEETCPRVTGVTFGIDASTTSDINLVAWGTSAVWDLPSSTEWPAPGEGTSVVFDYVRTSHLFELYWFAGYTYYSEQEFVLGPNPRQGGVISDDDVPANLDPIEFYGKLGMNGAVGLTFEMSTPTVELSWGGLKAIHR